MMQALPSQGPPYKATLWFAPISKLAHAPTYRLVHPADKVGFISELILRRLDGSLDQAPVLMVYHTVKGLPRPPPLLLLAMAAMVVTGVDDSAARMSPFTR
jgi:hypothetical protein